MSEKKQYLLSDGAITLRRYFSLKHDPELFLVVWESNSDPEREIQVGLCAYKNRVAQVDIPQDTPGDD
ncbi:MAG: hypothetical protein HPY81_07215, partial [Firmicutes bacterium]|nr:hypothetical protein [Bacillota bacterium]